MKDATKIAIGAGVTVLLGWFIHGPAGFGAAFVRDLQDRAGISLAARGINDLSVSFPTRPLSRVAILSGSLSNMDKSNAAGIVNSIPGVSFTRWAGRQDVAAQAKPAAPAKVAVANEAAAPASATTPAAAPAAAPAQVVQCQSGVDDAVHGRTLNFRSGSAWLNADSRKIIADVATTLKGCAGMTVEVGGHTDGHGNEGINKALSEERAKRVRDELIARGVSGTAVSARGYGSSAPIKAGDRMNPANRRIAFTVAKGGA